MSVEPGLIDANVLVYAMDVDAPQHRISRALIDAVREAGATLYVTSQILCEFYAIVTNPRRVAQPRTPADALGALAGFTGLLRVLPTPARAVDIWMDLLRRHPVTGGDIFDLQLIATMQANGIHRIYTFNIEDFRPFSELEIVLPTA